MRATSTGIKLASVGEGGCRSHRRFTWESAVVRPPTTALIGRRVAAPISERASLTSPLRIVPVDVFTQTQM